MNKQLAKKILTGLYNIRGSDLSIPRSHLIASIAGAVVALIIVTILAAIPSDNSTETDQSAAVDISRDVKAASQRNDLDNALREVVVFKKIKSIHQEPIFNADKNQHASHLDSVNPTLIEPENNLPIFTGSATASFPFVYPVMGPRKSSGYGLRYHPIRRFSSEHKGIDLAAPVGASIRSMAGGKVIFADPYAGYGNLIVIDHGNGVTTHYAHCDRLVVHTGEHVKTGQIIAEVGSTGMSTGPHLHLEARINGQPVNPEKYFSGLADKAEG